MQRAAGLEPEAATPDEVEQRAAKNRKLEGTCSPQPATGTIDRLLLAARAGAGARRHVGIRYLRSLPTGGVVALYEDGERAVLHDGAHAVLHDPGDPAASLPQPQDVKDEPNGVLAVALLWLQADVYGDFATHERLIALDAEMFGSAGASEVIRFKRRFLTEPVNYDVTAILDVDHLRRVVVAEFECTMPGREGRGTDVIQLDADYRVWRVQAIRHLRDDRDEGLETALELK